MRLAFLLLVVVIAARTEGAQSLAGTTWKNAKGSGTFTFNEDGSVNSSWGMAGKWKPLTERKVELQWEAYNAEPWDMAPDGKALSRKGQRYELTGLTGLGEAPAPEDTATTGITSVTQALEPLRAEFTAKRLAAIQPVVEWYRQQLEQRALSAIASDAKTTATVAAELKALDEMSIGPDLEPVPTAFAGLRSDYMRRLDAALQPVLLAYRTDLTKRAREAATNRQAGFALACQNELALLPPPGPGCASLIIVKAMYGAGDKRIDVTKMLSGKTRQHRLHVKGPWKFPDPLNGTPKDLEIMYRFMGEIRTRTIGGGRDFSLP